MKKTYQQPMLIIVSVKQHLMHDTSPLGTNIYGTAVSDREVLSRHNIWDDDDEFDE